MHNFTFLTPCKKPCNKKQRPPEMSFTCCVYKNMKKRNVDIYAECRHTSLQIKFCVRKLSYHELKICFKFFRTGIWLRRSRAEIRNAAEKRSRDRLHPMKVQERKWGYHLEKVTLNQCLLTDTFI